MSNPDYSFGNWVKRRRKALDLTQQELAQRIGCSLSLIFKIESDERRPSRQIAALLAEELEIPTGQRELFLKIARQEKNTTNLDVIAQLSPLEPASPPKQNPGNLPLSPTLFVGREHEVRAITAQLLDPGCRLLTLTGPGGVGKTRLALEAGRQFESHFSDGVFFISLAGVSGGESVFPALADALGLSFSGPAEPIVQFASFLRSKEILLIVDNMEHLLESGYILGEILQSTQTVKILVTSREQLRLQWEWLFEVQGLPIPEDVDANLENNSAVLLFLQRARQAIQDFSLDDGEAEALVRICKMVGGLPLAIELAASWVRVLSCREIAVELEHSLDLLETKKLDVPERHRSIRTVFEHSWAMLSGEEQDLLMRLSVFKSGFVREAALSITGASLSLLSSLVDRSLLRHSKNPDRYDLHELIRQYAFGQLQGNPNVAAQTFERYAQYYANWIAALEVPFKSPQQPQTSHLIRTETSNWHSAWQWAMDHGRLDLLRKMSPCLNWYFEVHGNYDEALFAFRVALERFRAYGAPAGLKNAEERSAFAGLLDQVGWFEFRKGNVEKGAALFAESLRIACEFNDPETLYYIYGNWGYLALMIGDISEAERLTSASLDCARKLNSPWHIAIPINVLGIVAYEQGNLREAFEQLTESLEIWRSVGDPRGLVFCMLYLGMTALAMNDIPTARAILKESNEIAEANMDRWAHALGLDLLGMSGLGEGQNEEALACFTKSIALSKEIGDHLNGTQTLIHLGQAYAALKSEEQAQRLYLDAYGNARQANWAPVILNALVSFVELQNGLPPETKLAVALSVLSHPAVTPNLRARSERMRGEASSCLSAEQTRAVEQLAIQKSAEVWADEILK
jgi:predicted ATPase/transcriptional regulator with XRE-family HTH domain